MRLFNKKGMTLVELIVTSIVTVVVIAAAVPCLFLAMDTAKSGNTNLQQYESANLSEGYLKSALETAKDFNFIYMGTGGHSKPKTGYSFYFTPDDKNTLFVELDNKLLTKIEGIKSISFEKAYNDKSSIVGENNSKRNYLSYKIVSIYNDEEITLEGATVLLNSSGTPKIYEMVVLDNQNPVLLNVIS